MKPLYTSLSILVLTSAALAQEPPKPAPQLAKFDRMIGVWEGSGTVTEGPGQPQMPWTCTTKIQKVLGGHFLRDDTRIEVGPGMPALCMTSLIGWDHENQRFMSYGIGNNGEASSAEMMFEDDDTVVQFSKMFPQGKMVMDRWTTNLGQDEYSFMGGRAIMNGRPFVHVRGKMTRVKTVEAAATKRDDSPFLGVIVGEEMKQLARMAGTYTFKGAMKMGGDMPDMQIHGTQEIHAAFGGTVIEMTTVGEPGYQGWAAMAWDAHEKAYRIVFANNMGENGETWGRWVGKDFVVVNSGTQMGMPMAVRTIMKCDDKGHIVGFKTHRITGTEDPVEAMNLEYVRK